MRTNYTVYQNRLALEALRMYCFWGREEDDYEA